MILAAGALQSPQILQLSGIGPADLLQQHGIRSSPTRRKSARTCRTTTRRAPIVRLKTSVSLNNDVRNPVKLAQMGLAMAVHGLRPADRRRRASRRRGLHANTRTASGPTSSST